MNIYQKLANVRKAVDFIQKKRVIKDGKDTLGYAVVSSSLVLNPLNEAINEQGLFLTVEMVSQETKSNQFEYETWDKFQKMNVKKLKNEYVSTVNLKYTWVNIDNPEETITCLWSCEAINNAGDPAKSIGSALTYAEKYFLLKFFNVATDEYDPDLQVKDDSKNKKEQHQEVEQPKKNSEKLKEASEKGFEFYINFVNGLIKERPSLTNDEKFNKWVEFYKPKSISEIKQEQSKVS